MKHLTPAILALAALAPAASALTVEDGDVKLGLVLLLQVRAERGWSRGVDGNPYNVAESAADSRPDNADFYLRRFRFGFKGTYKDDYRFTAIFRTDAADRTGDALTSTTTGPATTTSGDPLNRVPQIQQAVIERVYKQESTGLEHSLRAGLDYAFFGAEAVYSAPFLLFPTNRATTNAAFLAPRGVGVGYKLSGKALGKGFTWGVDVQNNVGDDSAAVTGNTGGATYNQKGEGMCYTTRLQFVPFDDAPNGHMKPVESFVGAPGTGVLVGLEAGINRNNNTGVGTPTPTAGNATQNLKAAGIEVLVHVERLTALAEFRSAQLVTDASTPALSTDRGSRAMIIQAGYALPIGSAWVEPALRFSRIDFDRNSSESSNYGTTSGTGLDCGSSGYQTELGVNCYLNKYGNKLQLAWQNWRGETGGTALVDHPPADANIVRAQWQLSF